MDVERTKDERGADTKRELGHSFPEPERGEGAPKKLGNAAISEDDDNASRGSASKGEAPRKAAAAAEASAHAMSDVRSQDYFPPSFVSLGQ